MARSPLAYLQPSLHTSPRPPANRRSGMVEIAFGTFSVAGTTMMAPQVHAILRRRRYLYLTVQVSFSANEFSFQRLRGRWGKRRSSRCFIDFDQRGSP